MSERIRTALAIFFLFGAVAVDFVSSFMSMAFDAVFITGALFVLWPLIRREREQ